VGQQVLTAEVVIMGGETDVAKGRIKEAAGVKQTVKKVRK
jgi:hypothetical protein